MDFRFLFVLGDGPFAIFFYEDFNTAGDWIGNDSTDNTKHVDADCDGSEYGESRKLKTFALDLWRNNVSFDLKINDGVDEEGEAGAPNVESEKECDDTATDEGAKHRDKAKDASNETEWQSEACIESEDDA